MMNWDSRKVQSSPEKSGQMCMALLGPLRLHSPSCPAWEAFCPGRLMLCCILAVGSPSRRSEGGSRISCSSPSFQSPPGCVPANNPHFQGSSLPLWPSALRYWWLIPLLSLQLGGGKNCIISCPRTAPASVGSTSLLTSSLIVSLLSPPLMTLIWV